LCLLLLLVFKVLLLISLKFGDDVVKLLNYLFFFLFFLFEFCFLIGLEFESD